MCIRDRGRTAPCRDLDFPVQAPAGCRGGVCSSIAGERCKACLLYTSDAADERSSVDLGGRRIIKKKKRIDLSLSPLTSQNHALVNRQE